MRITDTVALVASGSTGLGLTHALDCNVYLVDAGEEAALIDAGCGLEPEQVVSRIRASGTDPQKVTQVLLTHCHADHSAGAYFFAREFDCSLVAPKASAEALREADEETTSIRRARAAGGYPQDYELRPLPVTCEVSGEDVVRIGSLQVEVLETPGHSFDHVSYLLQDNELSVLFSGDVILTDGRIMLIDTPDCSVAAYSETIRYLATLPLNSLMPGHGAFKVTGAEAVFAQATSYFERLVLPPSWS